MHRRTVPLLLLAVGASATLGAIFRPVDVRNVPVERVTANLERELAASPRDAGILINLARVHAMAFAQKRDTVPSARPMGIGKPEREAAPFLGQGVPEYKQPDVRGTDDRDAQAAARMHLEKAISRYREALKHSPGHPVATMGLGWTLAQAGDRSGAIATLRLLAPRSGPPDPPAAGDPDSMANRPVFMGERTLFEEAARYLIPLLDPVTDRDEIAELRKGVKEAQQHPRVITPIAVPLADGLTAADIEDHGGAVAFDADGSALPQRWTWIRPNAGWLVFDRHHEGRITSGLQLFGSVTFWLFWQNGYDALRSLDDSGDGAIDGRELDGLSIWHDRNANGVSERGEVRPVAAWGVTSLSTAYEHDATHPDEIAFSPRGVTFSNGAARPTYDLILRSRRPQPVNNPITR
jgi:hypothetical protein